MPGGLFFSVADVRVWRCLMPPPPPQPSPDTLAVSAHPVWQSGDWFRAVLFGSLGLLYAILLFPLAIAVAVLWLVIKFFDRGPASS
jgi:uncharacterized membrane protein